MSDFLTRIVQRQRGELPTIQPRIPPMFAPESKREPEPPVAPAWMSALPAEPPKGPAVSEKAPRRVAPPERPAPDGPGVAVSNTARSGQKHQPLVRHRNPNATLPHEKETPVQKRPSPLPYPTKPESSAIPQPQAAESDPSLPETVGTNLRAMTEYRTHTVMPPPRLVRKESPSTADSGSAPPSLVATVPVRQSRAVPQDNAEPPVQVTIGRIEVTAANAPPAPKRKSPKPKPSMSLRDYLAQRQGGTR